MLYYNNVLSVSSPSKLDGDKGGVCQCADIGLQMVFLGNFSYSPQPPLCLEGVLFT